MKHNKKIVILLIAVFLLFGVSSSLAKVKISFYSWMAAEMTSDRKSVV